VAAVNEATYRRQWTTAPLGISWNEATRGMILRPNSVVWFRCTVRLPTEWIAEDETKLVVSDRSTGVTAWMNGTPFKHLDSDVSSVMRLHQNAIVADDINLLTIRTEFSSDDDQLPVAPRLLNGGNELPLDGRWQFRIGDDPAWSNIPLPAKFGMGSDVLFEPH
jgi:hypothetical protein